VAARFIQAGYQENTLAKTPLGKLPREAIRLLELPRPPQDIIDGFMTLVDLTGKWRMETVEVNGVVQICGIQVRPGDLVCADEAGVAFVPRARGRCAGDRPPDRRGRQQAQDGYRQGHERGGSHYAEIQVKAMIRLTALTQRTRRTQRKNNKHDIKQPAVIQREQRDGSE